MNAVEGRLHASRIIAEQPGTSLRAVARDAQISLSTAQDVRKRMEREEDPVPARFATQAGVSQPRTDEAPDGVRTSPSTLHILRRDPSLRFSETGRALLQWLGVYAAQDKREEIVNAIPEHCARVIVELARDCAENWNQLGDDLERRLRSTTSQQMLF